MEQQRQLPAYPVFLHDRYVSARAKCPSLPGEDHGTDRAVERRQFQLLAEQGERLHVQGVQPFGTVDADLEDRPLAPGTNGIGHGRRIESLRRAYSCRGGARITAER
jgi:hypothetical protein